jgi:outer membrane protein assembly factor BamA
VRSTLFLIVLLITPPALGAPRITDLRFEGPPTVDTTVLRAAAARRLGDPADPATLLDILARLTVAGAVGSVDFDLEPVSGSADEVVLHVRFDGRRRYVERVDISAPGKTPRREASQLRRRRAISEGTHLQLEEGGRFHPYLLELDRLALEAVERRRGHLDAKVTTLAPTSGDLTRVLFVVDRGPTYRYYRLKVTGVPAGVDVGAPRIESGELAVDTDLEAERERLVRAVCDAGYPDAQVAIKRASNPQGGLNLTYLVTAGPSFQLGRVTLQGDSVPAGIVGLRSGAPYCGAGVDERLGVLREHLRGQGHLGARVSARRDRKSGRVDLTLRVNRGAVAHLRRIWFRGQEVSRERMLRQLISVREDDVVRPALIRQSVEDLRRSDLFLRVTSRLVESTRPGDYYLVFELTERDLATIDFDTKTLRLHNMNLSVPDSTDRAADGVTLRGGGQLLRLRGDEDWYGFGLRDPFLWKSVVAALDVDLRFHDFDALEETTLRTVGGVGLRTWRNQLTLEGLWFLLYAQPTADEAVFEQVPVVRRPSLSTGPGARFRLDLNRLDDERIAYLGVDLGADLFTSMSPFPGAPWTSWSARLGVNLPLLENRRGQHWAVHLGLEGEWIKGTGITDLASDDEHFVFGFQRGTPNIRGYSSTAIRRDFVVDDTTTVRLGGAAAFEGTLELRIPLKRRRNALVPFIDFASIGARDDAPWADPVLSAGAQLDFSLFGERLEGALFAAFPFDSALASDIVGVGARGSFE